MRVPVPVAFPNADMIVLIAIGVVLAPMVLMIIVNLITSRKSNREEGQKKGVASAAVSGFVGGLLILLVGGSMTWALAPYLKGKEAFSAVKESYNTNISVEKSMLPVATFADDVTDIKPIPVSVYRVKGGSSEECIIYIEKAHYVLYCGDPLTEFTSSE